MIGRTNAGGSGGGLNKSVIIVTAPTGATVTCKSGTTTKTAAEKNGTWTFTGLDNGTWTITATKSGQTATKSVTITRLEVEYVTIAYNQIPEFTYTGDYEIVNDSDETITVSQDNWKIRFLTSGTLIFTDLRGAENGIDVFLVGGGGGGGGDKGGGGGSGYTVTANDKDIAIGVEYPIVIGAGGSGGSGGHAGSAGPGGSGGSTSFLGLAAKGGSGGKQYPNCAGGSGGSGGGGGYDHTAGGIDGANGANGNMGGGGSGRGTTTREFGESTGKLYASGGDGAYIRSGSNNTGDGGDGRGESNEAGYSGGSGIVIIRNARGVA